MQTSLKPEQNFCVISMLTPNSFPETKRAQFQDQKILGIKVRGVFETYEEAKTRCNTLQKLDKYHNIFVGEVGKWLPFNVDISTMETEDDPVYREQALNQYMKAYKDTLKEEEVEEQTRKEQTLKGNNAKVVTGKTDAPEATGIGCPEITAPGVIPSSYQTSNETTETETKTETKTESKETESVQVSKNDNPNIDDQINAAKNDKTKIEIELENSKNNIKELETKLLAINEIYADLKN